MIHWRTLIIRGSSLSHELVQVAGVGHDVKLAPRVLSEAGDVAAGIEIRVLGELAGEASAQAKAPDPAVTVIAIEVGSLQTRNRGAAVDVAADHGTALAVVVDQDRGGEAGLVAP